MRVACYCGAVYNTDTDDGRCPYCGAVVDSPLPLGIVAPAALDQLAAWRTERRQIRASQQWAYAMGSGCSMGFLPTESRAVLARELDLAALIAEHTPTEEGTADHGEVDS